MFELVVAFLGGMFLYRLVPRTYVKKNKNEAYHSRLTNNPLPIEVYKQAGDDLARAEVWDEIVLRQNLKQKSFSEVKNDIVAKQRKNKGLLDDNHFNDNSKIRSTYVSPGGQLAQWPQVNMASGWYAKAVQKYPSMDRVR